jgi:hypothetical protein
VRIGTTAGNSTAGGSSASNSTPITESAIIGLTTDLQQRPVKGAAYANGAVAVIDQNGQLEAAAGAPGSCVMVDGTTGPCGGSGPSFLDAEIPGGAINGTNRVFTLQNSPSGSSLMLFRNGMYMLAGLDYTLTGSTIQFVPAAIPQTADILVASYRLASTSAESSSGGTNSSSVTLATPQVICSGVGASTSAASMTDLGGCALPAASLQAGNRIEIRFTFSHAGSSSGFSFEADWGTSAILSRQASAADVAAAGSADSAMGASAAQISYQSWGSTLALGAGIQNTSALTGIRVGFKAMVSTAGTDSVSLASYTVLLYPAN